MFRNIFDSHTHSDNSPDAQHSVTFMCEKAIAQKVLGLCITDHCELRTYEQEHYETRIAQSVFEARKARKIFNGRLSVRCGIELSDILYDPAHVQRLLEQYTFDLVLASQHNTADGTDIYYTNFKEWSATDVDTYLQWYFETLIALAKWNNFDILAHLTYPVRYITGVHKISVDLHRYDDQIDTLLRILVQNGKGIEINTSGLGQELGDTMPPLTYVKRYRELGGEYITLGSDAHTADAIGHGIQAGMQMLLDSGFQYFTFYEERCPLQMKIS